MDYQKLVKARLPDEPCCLIDSARRGGPVPGANPRQLYRRRLCGLLLSYNCRPTAHEYPLVDIDERGQIECLRTEVLPLHELGRLEVVR